MSYVPWQEDWNHPYGVSNGVGTARTIIVAALSENKRPVGFAPWPKQKKAKKRKKS